MKLIPICVDCFHDGNRPQVAPCPTHPEPAVKPLGKIPLQIDA